MPSIEQNIVAAERDLKHAVGFIFTAARNLRELRPGFASTTAGNGAPGGGKGASNRRIAVEVFADTPDRTVRRDAHEFLYTDYIPATSVEQLALAGEIVNDPAVIALTELAQLAEIAAKVAARTKHLAERFGWATPGDYDPNARPRGKATEHATNAERYCWNCARLRNPDGSSQHRTELVHRHVQIRVRLPQPNKKGEREEWQKVGLCRWCYDHRDPVTNEPPDLELVDLHHRGWIVTSAIKKRVDDRRRAAERADKKAGTNKRKKGKR